MFLVNQMCWSNCFPGWFGVVGLCTLERRRLGSWKAGFLAQLLNKADIVDLDSMLKLNIRCHRTCQLDIFVSTSQVYEWIHDSIQHFYDQPSRFQLEKGKNGDMLTSSRNNTSRISWNAPLQECACNCSIVNVCRCIAFLLMTTF